MGFCWLHLTEGVGKIATEDLSGIRKDENGNSRTWANRHLDSYDGQTTAAGVATLRQRLPEGAPDILEPV